MNDSIKNIYTQVAKITFFLYFFFTLFGTSLPFRSGTRDPSELGTSNIVNQIVFSTLFLTALFSIIPKTNQVIALIKREKFLLIFLLWCTLSIIWADYSFVVVKRLFQLYTAVIVCLSFLVHSESSEDAFFTIKIFFSVFMLASLVSIFTIPGAVSRHYKEWQGLATHKNHLGEDSLISIIFWLYTLVNDKSVKSKLFSLFMLMVSLFLLFGAQSITSISTFLFLLLVWFLFAVDKLFNPIGIRRTFTLLFLVFAGSLTILTFLFSKELIASIFALAGKNLTLTGRTDLWADVMVEVKKHLLIGCGYKGFWIVDSPRILEIYETYIWLPRQSHNGYIDILNETGLVGLLSFSAIVINYFVNLVKYKEKSIWLWFVVIALIENFTESVLLSAGGIMTLLFLFSYLSLFSNVIHKEQINSESEMDRAYQKF